MIEELSKRLTAIFIDNKIVKSEDREIYNYCFEITIIMGISYFLLIVLSILFKEIIASFIFLISFLIFRKTSGGYHANNYLVCGTMSLISYLFLILVIKQISIFFKASFILLIIGLTIILVLSPIQNKNKPFTEKQYKRFKTISKGLAAVLIFLFTTLELCGYHEILISKYYFSFCYGIDLVAISLIISKIERRISNEKI